MRRANARLDQTDRRIINALQDDLPLVERPFEAVATALGIAEEALLTRLDRLHNDGVITRFGPFFDAAAMGGAFCLCAMAVPPGRFQVVAEWVNAFPEVAHNYERAHRINMWFVLATDTQAAIETTADRIEAETGLPVLRFPKLEEFFIGFRVAA